jgi:hypothetical protein
MNLHRPVLMSRALKDKLDGLAPSGHQTFKASFLDWAAAGKPNPHAMFGRNKTERDLSHVHLHPTLTDPESLERWRFRGTSDRNLFYVDSRAHGYLLIDIVGDPGAHDMWKPTQAKKLGDWTEVAEAFCLGGAEAVSALMLRRALSR